MLLGLARALAALRFLEEAVTQPRAAGFTPAGCYPLDPLRPL